MTELDWKKYLPSVGVSVVVEGAAVVGVTVDLSAESKYFSKFVHKTHNFIWLTREKFIL